MKMIVESEVNTRVVDDSGNTMFKGTRIQCVEFIADVIEANLLKHKGKLL